MSAQETIFARDLAGLTSAEDFLKALNVPYDAHIVAVNRLHILKRFNTYLEALGHLETLGTDERRNLYRTALCDAYGDFVSSTAQSEKVFAVFKRSEPGFVPISAIAKPHKA